MLEDKINNDYYKYLKHDIVLYAKNYVNNKYYPEMQDRIDLSMFWIIKQSIPKNNYKLINYCWEEYLNTIQAYQQQEKKINKKIIGFIK